jgi:hypothetical protein
VTKPKPKPPTELALAQADADERVPSPILPAVQQQQQQQLQHDPRPAREQEDKIDKKCAVCGGKPRRAHTRDGLAGGFCRGCRPWTRTRTTTVTVSLGVTRQHSYACVAQRLGCASADPRGTSGRGEEAAQGGEEPRGAGSPRRRCQGAVRGVGQTPQGCRCSCGRQCRQGGGCIGACVRCAKCFFC